MHNFYDLSARVAPNNDIAQRNLNVQKMTAGTAGGNQGLHASLAWIGLANPFEEPAAASLQIDTPDLAALVRDLAEAALHASAAAPTGPKAIPERISGARNRTTR